MAETDTRGRENLSRMALACNLAVGALDEMTDDDTTDGASHSGQNILQSNCKALIILLSVYFVMMIRNKLHFSQILMFFIYLNISFRLRDKSKKTKVRVRIYELFIRVHE